MPCLSCQTIENYARQLIRVSAATLLEAIVDYEMRGSVVMSTCQCLPVQRPIRTLPPPPAICILSEHSSWAFDVVVPSGRALQWIKQRLEERHVLEKMRAAWTAFAPNTLSSFVPHASFRDGSASDLLQEDSHITFGPCIGRGAGLKLLSEHSPEQRPLGSWWDTFLYPYRPSIQFQDKASSAAMEEVNMSVGRESDSRTKLNLSHVIGVMVKSKDFDDVDGLSVFGASRRFCVEVFLSEAAVFSSFPLLAESFDRRKISSLSQNRTLKDISGVTVLFLGCWAIQDDEACEKLLNFRDTGAAILEDLLSCQYTDIIANKVYTCVRNLWQSAMGMRRPLAFQALCRQLAHWATVLLRKTIPIPEAEHSAFENNVRVIFNLWNWPVSPVGPRLFTPDIEEGWEDTAEVTMMGVLYGCAAAVASIDIMENISRGANRDFYDTLPPNLMLPLFKAIFDVDVPDCSETELLRLLKTHMPSESPANLQYSNSCDPSLLSLYHGLHQVRSNIQAISKHYEEQVDGNRLYHAFRQAFSCVIRPYSRELSEISGNFFRPDHPDLTYPGNYNCLSDGMVTHYNPEYGKAIFKDLASLRLEWPDRPTTSGIRSRLRDLDIVSPLARLESSKRQVLQKGSSSPNSGAHPPRSLLSNPSKSRLDINSSLGLRRIFTRFSPLSRGDISGHVESPAQVDSSLRTAGHDCPPVTHDLEADVNKSRPLVWASRQNKPTLSQKRINAWDSRDVISQHHPALVSASPEASSSTPQFPYPSNAPQVESADSPSLNPGTSHPSPTSDLEITIPAASDAAWVALPASYPSTAPQPPAAPTMDLSLQTFSSPITPASVPTQDSEKTSPYFSPQLGSSCSTPTQLARAPYPENSITVSPSATTNSGSSTGAVVLLIIAMLSPSSFSAPLILVVLLLYFVPAWSNSQCSSTTRSGPVQRSGQNDRSS